MRSTICLRCHRALKDPRSIEIGMGKICAGKAKAEKALEKQDELFDFDRDCVSPVQSFSSDIILSRLPDGTPQANLPQRIKYHSPTGFEWGYGGSGPADLALNILSMFIPQDEAFRLHQLFKSEFIASIKREGGIIPNVAIREWIKSHRKEQTGMTT